MPNKDIIVLGASAGGFDALRTLFSSLPEDFPAAVFVVLHTSHDSPRVMADVFDKAGPLRASYAVDGERIESGRIYVAPPDHHLLVLPGKVAVTRGPRENRFRPAVDPLFRSAARTYGPRVVGVILSGALDDGVNGLWAVRQLGGTAVIQDPVEALEPSMPLSASRHVRIDHITRIGELAPLLVRLSATRADDGGIAVSREIEIEVKIAHEVNARAAGVQNLGAPSVYACPECHGVLLQMQDAVPPRFRCHTGHGFSLESLISEMDKGIEDSLWSAIRALEEKVLLVRQAAKHGEEVHGEHMNDLLELAENEQQRADVVRSAAMGDEANAHEREVRDLAAAGSSPRDAGRGSR